MSKINSSDISVVVQGAIDKENTPKCLESIRKYLPKSQIILSTWEGSNVEGLDYDKVIFNKDPGAYPYVRSDKTVTPNNVNRQLISTQNGLKQIDRKYALKFRSDLILESDNFLNYFNKYPKRNKKYSFFEKRVIIPSVYTKKTSLYTGYPMLFHPSDWWFFGLTKDLKLYFLNIELAKEPDFSEYKVKYPNKNPNPMCRNRMFAEQYYCFNAFKQKFKNLKFEDWTDWNDENTFISEQLIINNFIILDYNQHFIANNKLRKLIISHPNEHFVNGLYSFDIFNNDYKLYCNKFNLFIDKIKKFIQKQNKEKIYD